MSLASEIERAVESEEERPRPEEEDHLHRLLNDCLAQGAPCSATEDLPLLIGHFCRADQRVRRDSNGQIISHAALYTHRISSHGLELAIGIIGGVATTPASRGLGHARTLVVSLCEAARRASVDAVLLWPQVEGYYERMGFVWAGEETIVAIPRVSALPLREGLELRPAVPGDLAAMADLHRRTQGTPQRDRFTWAAHLSIPLCEFFVLEERGVITGYAVVGKGRDLQGCIHEIITTDLLIPELAQGIAATSERPVTYLMLPPRRRAARTLFEGLGFEIHQGPLALMHLPDPSGLWKKLGLAGPLPGELEDDHQRLCMEIFGPAPGVPLDPSLPLELYLSGLDSM